MLRLAFLANLKFRNTPFLWNGAMLRSKNTSSMMYCNFRVMHSTQVENKHGYPLPDHLVFSLIQLAIPRREERSCLANSVIAENPY